MRLRLTESLRCLALVCAVVLGTAGRALAVDGVIEINQARALQGGVTPGDTPGFPVTIDTPGSYRLTGNLTLPGGADAILITTDHVTLDLNGFAILGCVPAPPAFCIAGPDTGVNADGRSNVTVVNGTVRGMARDGIMTGANGRVERIRAILNGRDGISVGNSSLVTGSTASQNGRIGIFAADRNSTVSGNTATNNVSAGIRATASMVTGNLARNNGGNGIQAGDVADNSPGESAVSGNTVVDNAGDGIECGSGCSVVGNAASHNSGLGLRLGSTAGYVHNVLSFNANPQVSGGIQMGANVCGTALCP
jgi:parallel beta-helix repeat protein